MVEWLETVLPAGYATAVLWVGAALLALFVVLLLIRLLRSFTSGTFVAGGRNRRARLAVMDAAPVDSRRRLVLVRRDDVEHLILIGGPTDVVVERDIRLMPRQARPVDHDTLGAHDAAVGHARPAPRPAEPPVPVKPVPAAPVARPNPAHNVTLPRPSMPMSAAPAAPARGAASKPAQTPFNRLADPPWKRNASAVPAQTRQPGGDLDDALADELQASLSEKSPAGKEPAPSIDDEMTRILGELASSRR